MPHARAGEGGEGGWGLKNWWDDEKSNDLFKPNICDKKRNIVGVHDPLWPVRVSCCVCLQFFLIRQRRVPPHEPLVRVRAACAAPLCAACLHLNKVYLSTLGRPGGDGLQPAVEPPFRLSFACANVYVSVRSAALSPQTPPKTTRARLPVCCAFTRFNSGEGRRHAEQVQRR